MDIINFITMPENTAFSVSFAFLIAILMVEIIGLMIGFTSLSMDADAGLDADADVGFFGNIIAWVNPSGLPFMILLAFMLMYFTAIGYTTQGLMIGFFGFGLPTSMAAPISFVLSLVVSHIFSEKLGRFLPKDETYAVSIENLVDREGIVVISAKNSLIGRILGQIKVKDHFGNTHYVSYFSEDEMEVGDTAILVSLENVENQTFEAKKIFNN